MKRLTYLLLLTLPAAALLSGVQFRRRVRGLDVAQAVLFGLIGLNYIATQSALAALGLGPGTRMAVLSVNGIALAGLFAIYFAEAQGLRRPRQC